MARCSLKKPSVKMAATPWERRRSCSTRLLGDSSRAPIGDRSRCSGCRRPRQKRGCGGAGEVPEPLPSPGALLRGPDIRGAAGRRRGLRQAALGYWGAHSGFFPIMPNAGLPMFDRPTPMRTTTGMRVGHRARQKQPRTCLSACSSESSAP